MHWTHCRKVNHQQAIKNQALAATLNGRSCDQCRLILFILNFSEEMQEIVLLVCRYFELLVIFHCYVTALAF